MKRLGGTALAAAALALLAGCGGAAPGNGAVREIRVVATEHQFGPDTITVKAGERVRIVVLNQGSEDHEFESDEAQIEEVVIPPGQERIIDWTAPAAPGEYEFVCDAPGHREAGMTGKLIVE